jgi:hypothetical protein
MFDTDIIATCTNRSQEFGFGLYDGITGIVTDPYKGAKKEGGIGFVKGVGRGIMSVPFRVMGGAWSVPGYAMKGLYQEMVKSKGKSVQNYIIAARIAQGYDEASSVTQQERDDIVKKWSYMKWGIKKKRNPGADQMDSLHSLVQQKRDKKTDRSARLNAPESQPLVPANMPSTDQYPDPPRRRGVEPEIRSTVPSWRQQEAQRTRELRRQETGSSGTTSTTTPQQSHTELEAQLKAEEEEEQRELERAIAASVAEASRGDPDEDRLVASAIRASIAELERAPAGSTTQADEEEALKRAMQASLEEAGKTNVTAKEQKALEETLRKSLLETSRRQQHSREEEDDDTEEDEDYQRIIEESKKIAQMHEKNPTQFETGVQGAKEESGMMDAMSQAIGAADDDDEKHRGLGTQGLDDDDELKKVLAESEQAETERLGQLEKQKTEEDIVMEYVRKQSLLEEEHRQRVAGSGGGGAAK